MRALAQQFRVDVRHGEPAEPVEAVAALRATEMRDEGQVRQPLPQRFKPMVEGPAGAIPAAIVQRDTRLGGAALERFEIGQEKRDTDASGNQDDRKLVAQRQHEALLR